MSRPGFPRDSWSGLAVKAADPDPGVRILATYDPALSSDDADRLSREEDRTVRLAATRHPNLPLTRIRELLISPRGVYPHVEAAAANPSLPVEDMHRIIDEQFALDGGY